MRSTACPHSLSGLRLVRPALRHPAGAVAERRPVATSAHECRIADHVRRGAATCMRAGPCRRSTPANGRSGPGWTRPTWAPVAGRKRGGLPRGDHVPVGDVDGRLAQFFRRLFREGRKSLSSAPSPSIRNSTCLATLQLLNDRREHPRVVCDYLAYRRVGSQARPGRLDGGGRRPRRPRMLAPLGDHLVLAAPLLDDLEVVRLIVDEGTVTRTAGRGLPGMP
jgi:hypothetical protein